jgi:glycine/serine hydroxymethyltransferase
LDEHKPELVIFGKSMFIYQEPITFVTDFVKDWESRPVIMYDMAHVLGLYGAFQEPLTEGADVITGSTHKTFFGPQRGLVAGNFSKGSPLRKLWLDIKSRAFPGSTSNHHLGTLLALLMAAYEMNQFKQEYQDQVQKNAKAYAKALKKRGIDVEGDEKDGYTQTHQVLIRIDKYGNGMDIAQKLEENNILTNYQALPDDVTFLEPSGIRMGVQEMTRFGMTEEDFGVLAGFVSAVVLESRDVKEEVRDFRQNFLEMKYCLPAEESIQAAAEIFRSIFSYPRFGESFIKSLENNVRNS